MRLPNVINHNVGVGFDWDSIIGIVFKQTRCRTEKVMPTEASADEMWIKSISDFSNSKNRSWVFKNNEETNRAQLIFRVDVLNAAFEHLDQSFQITGFFFIFRALAQKTSASSRSRLWYT